MTGSEKQYLSARENFTARYDRQFIADNFPLFIQRQQLTRLLFRHELFKMALNVKGSVVECGVHHGTSLMLFAHLSSIYEPYAFNREIIGFDTFSGFPHINIKDGFRGKIGEMGDVDMDSLKRCIELYDMNRPLGHIPKIKFIQGDAIKTIPQYFKEAAHTIVALLYIDFDLYQPAKIALQTILPRMPKGSIVAFDEVNARQWPGETQALLESLDIRRLRLEKFTPEPYMSYAMLD